MYSPRVPRFMKGLILNTHFGEHIDSGPGVTGRSVFLEMHEFILELPTASLTSRVPEIQTHQ